MALEKANPRVDSKIKFPLGVEEVRKFLPHRFPLLLIDRILNIETSADTQELDAQSRVGTRVTALKNVTVNEEVFQGHFPEYRLLPGVYQIEMMAQAAGFTLYPMVRHRPKLFVEKYRFILSGVNDARFRREVTPGDRLTILTELVKVKGPIWVFACKIMVEDQKAAEAEIFASLLPNVQVVN